MSLISKGTKSIRKQDVMEQKSVALGFKKIVFAHKANAGEVGINLTSLVTPPEMITDGFVNPPASTLSRVNIYQYRNNLKLVSSLSGLLIPSLSYKVSSSTYIGFNNFTAAQDEIFLGYLDEAPATSLSVVDGINIIASGTLLAGQTDFNIGTPIEINKNPSQQMGSVMVFADRQLQYRKVGNNPAGSGDYIEVPVAGGLGSLIRFTASGSSRTIVVVSNGVVAERPDGSLSAMVERTQGQIDAMIPYLATLASVPQTTFQTAPNNVDLKQFGDIVLDLATDKPATALVGTDIDWSVNRTFSKTISSNEVITFSNVNDGAILTVAIEATGAYSVTFSDANLVWNNGTSPSQTASKTDLYTFVKIGTKIYGSAVQNYA